MPKTLSRFSEALAAGLAFVVYLWPRWEQITFSVFQTRDLERARQVLQGKWFFFGPEMTGGGHLPGGLYYYLLSLPLSLSADWRGAWYLLLVLSGAAMVVAWYVVRARFGLGAALVLVLGVLGSRQIVRNLVSFNNASYALPFFLLALLAICIAFTGVGRERRWWWLFGSLVMGLGAQIHMSIVLFFAGGMIVQAAAPKLHLQRLPSRDFILGLVLFGFCWMPYLVAQIAWRLGLEWGMRPFDFTGGYGGGPEFMLDHTLRQIQGTVFDPEMALENFANSLAMIIPALALIMAAPLALRRSVPPPAAKEWCKIILVLLVTSLSVTLPFVAGHVYMRYATGVSIALCALVALTPLWIEIRGTVLRASVALGLLAVGCGFHFAPRAPRLFLNMPTVREATALVTEIKSRTGWSYEEFRDRIFYVNFHAETSVRDLYEESYPVKASEIAPAPDGYFAVMESPLAWLQNASVPEEIVGGVESGGIELGEEISISPRITLIPYVVRNQMHFPSHFHNLGLGYSDEAKAMVRSMRERSQSQPRKTVAAFFNNCPKREEFCTIGLSAESDDLSNPRLPVTVQASGIPISVSSAWIAAGWTESLTGVYISALCAGKELRISLAQALGLSTKGNMRLRNNSQLAPFTRVVNWNCSERIERISLGYESSHGGTMFRNNSQKGNKQTFILPAPQR